MVSTANLYITTLGYLMFRHGSGLSYDVLDPFRLPVVVMPLPSSMVQAKLDELLQSRDQQVHALAQAQIALQKPTFRAADADERSQRACEQIEQYETVETELAEVRAELEARKSELEEVRLLTDAEHGWAKRKIEADTLRSLTMASFVSPDEDRVTRVLVERIRAMEAEMASPRWNEKGSDTPTSNEG